MSKGYSREGFEEASKQAEQEEKEGTGYTESEFSGVHAAEADVVRNYFAWRNSGQGKIEALLKAGHKEANALNEKFHRLKSEADEAEERLRDFCKNELGMKG
jgi:hypothetical protein